MARPTLLSLRFSREALRETRERAGLSFVQLADRCGKQGHPVHHSSIGKVERGVNGPSPALLKALAAALDVEVDQLLERGTGAA